jgi:hypothetical protein
MDASSCCCWFPVAGASVDAGIYDIGDTAMGRIQVLRHICTEDCA